MADATRQRILDAATTLFAHQGYGSTSVREVVERAGVTKPVLYYWFGDKEALYLQCVRAQFDAFADLVAESISQPGPVADRLRAFVHGYVARGLANVDGVRLAITATHPSVEKRPEIDLMSLHLEYFTAIEQMIADGVASGELRAGTDSAFATLTLIGMSTTLLKAALQGMPLPPDYADRAVNLFLHGVAPR